MYSLKQVRTTKLEFFSRHFCTKGCVTWYCSYSYGGEERHSYLGGYIAEVSCHGPWFGRGSWRGTAKYKTRNSHKDNALLFFLILNQR